MDGIHDLGGMHGFGRVVVERDEPVFHERWEGRVFGMTLLAGAAGVANLDRSRHAIENHDPARYLALGYYGRWLAALEALLLERGVIAEGDVEARIEGRPLAERPAPKLAPPTDPGARRAIDRLPAFAVGDPVMTRDVHTRGHTRLPRYARKRRGVIALVHPAWVFPDTHAHGLGENPQHVYAVRFDARELWGDEAERGTSVHVDLFESYLERA